MNLPRFILTAGLLAALPLLSAAEQPATPPPEETVILPTFEVPGKFHAKGWVYARIGQTEFLSQLSEKQTRNHADDFVTFQDFVRAQYPEAALPADQPVTVVLCDNTVAFRQFGGVSDRVTGTLPGSDRFILIDASQINQVESSIRRRWMELAFRRPAEGRYPLWREVATSQILSNILIRDGQLEIGLPQFFPAGTSAPGFNQFNLQSLIPVDHMLTMTRQSPDYADPASAVSWTFRSQSTAFMHMCLFGVRYQRFREPFKRFITRLETEPVSEALFRDCFKVGYSEMRRWLEDYAIRDSRMKYETRRYKFPPTAPVEVREALPVEVLRLLRESQRLLAVAEAEKTR